MQIVGYIEQGEAMVGRVDGDLVQPLAQREEFWKGGGVLGATTGTPRHLRDVRLSPSIPDTAKVVCVGLNYRQHALETGLDIPTTPVVFARWVETLIADGEESPAMDPLYDWEAELGVVIGAGGLAISEEAANDHIWGYCTFNDLSARTLQRESPQWALGKNTDKSGPIGSIFSRSSVGDPADGWSVTTRVNDQLVQDGNTSDFIFSVPHLIAFISRSMTLRAGDLIITGTPSGIGAARTPPIGLKPGDIVEVEVGNLGRVVTPIVRRN